MAVQVGQTLDKYELLERVGQGGMAIVYRGRDNSLRREVAVKVLHQHLAEHREARERFEREAHAVAKLRHENILEIYDFSGTESDESYIVTEFIDGQSLKEFITDNVIRFPEVGAMITLQVCKALQHAHAAGILHRDVKPENVMIRSDGVVKLTDFGIAQMIDLQRLTVTGQLLGSPAYMSPEHVNGGQLDFRTDVFALGIMLYQLITGELPFKGKNPHEILKRIAEGEYLDPSVVNPHVGKELRRIIRSSMARDKEDRYADVSMMLAALEKYLANAGVTIPRDELARYFDSPVSYEMAFKERLIEHLTRTGKTLLEAEQPAALDAFNRVLTLDPDNTEVLTLIDHLGARKRRNQIALIALGVALVIGLAWGTRTMMRRGEGPVASALTVPPIATYAVVVPDTADAAPAADALPLDAGESADAGAIDAPSRAVAIDAARVVAVRKKDAAPAVDIEPDASVLSGAPRRIKLSIFPPVGAEYRINGSGWSSLGAASRTIMVPPGEALIEGRNTECCLGASLTVPASATDGRPFTITLPFRPARITPTCEVPGVTVTVDGRGATLGAAVEVPIDESNITGKPVEVVFFVEESSDPSFYKKHTVVVGPAQKRVVKCQ